MGLNMTKEIIKKLFPEAADRIEKGSCPFCGKKINPKTEFKDELSKKEFTISGLCQGCQDETFGPRPTES